MVARLKIIRAVGGLNLAQHDRCFVKRQSKFDGLPTKTVDDPDRRAGRHRTCFELRTIREKVRPRLHNEITDRFTNAVRSVQIRRFSQKQRKTIGAGIGNTHNHRISTVERRRLSQYDRVRICVAQRNHQWFVSQSGHVTYLANHHTVRYDRIVDFPRADDTWSRQITRPTGRIASPPIDALPME